MVFVQPTYSENYGMAIAEALACGVPVVATNVTPWQELNTDIE
ncbi:MAG: glycosyltransferase [Bacteroidaceae bacterium]|nr:glycosyltransferase [Bacteroidaceae bacterium]